MQRIGSRCGRPGPPIWPFWAAGVTLLCQCLAHGLPAQAQAPASCPPYVSSPLYRPRLRQVAATPADWVQKIEGALAGDEVLLADGTYNLLQYAVQISQPITVRGATGNRAAVVIQGQGYGVGSEGFMVHAQNVTIADLTMTGMRHHAISIKGESGAEAPHVYNVHLYDIGTQHLKSTPGDGVANGVVACSRIGYSLGGVRGDYLNAIDIHRGIDWLVRDNEIYNIWGDGTGCEVDVSCGTYAAGGGPAILFWNASRGTIVERNRLTDCYRGIALGFGGAHAGGAVRNNFFYQSAPGRPGANGFIAGDMGVQIKGGSDITVDHNTVVLGGNYQGPIEIWDSANVTVRNNLLTRPVFDRGGNSGLLTTGNKTDAMVADLASAGDPHLAPGSGAIDFAATVDVPGVADDIDRDPRPQGVRRDAGCDERAVCTLDGGALSLHTLTPCRMVDTRGPGGAFGGPALASGANRLFTLAGSCAVPPSAKALSLNITVTGPTGTGFLRVTAGGCAVPLASAVNFAAGQTRANNAVLPVAADGSAALMVNAVVTGAGTVDLILDVNGYFD